MAQIENHEAKTVISLFCKLQSAIHDIDELSESVQFKQGLKMKTNAYLKYIENQTNFLGRAFDNEETDYFNSIVKEIDKIGESINVEQTEI